MMNLMNSSRTALEAAPFATPIDVLFYAASECALGEVLVARSAKGVCAISIGDKTEELEVNLLARFPKLIAIRNEDAIREDMAKVVRFAERPALGLNLTLDMRGTPFQRRVWEKIRAISAGRTITYTELAQWVGPLTSPRAVATACAANPIALAIPCHRVVRRDGALADYRWGIERKRQLIEKEAMA